MATIGEEFRRERTRKGLTYKDVEQVTHIRAIYIEAIEEGKFDVIPGKVYVKGFIRNYAKFLGLEGDRFVDQYKVLVGEKEVVAIRPQVTKASVVSHSSLEKKEKMPERLPYEGMKSRRRKTMAQERLMGVVLLIITVLFFLWLFFF